MADDDFDGFCPDCGTHFSNPETLWKHAAAIHKRKPPNQCAPASEDQGNGDSKRARDDNDMEESSSKAASSSAPERSENIELSPIFGVLSDAQKDSLLLRAVQRDPSFYDKIEEQAMLPLTEEAAEDAVKRGGAEGIASATRWYTSAGVPANALTLLIAASQKCLAALDALADSMPTSSSSGGATDAPATSTSGSAGDEEATSGADGPDDEVLAAVEALPAAGALGALWVEAFGARSFKRCVFRMAVEEAEQLRLLLEGLHAAAASVRPVHPALLVGPNGETIDTWTEALEALQAALVSGGPAKPAGGGKAAKL